MDTQHPHGRALDLPALLAVIGKPVDQLRIVAAVDALERCGAQTITYDHNAGAGWWAALLLRGARLTAEHHDTIADAFDGLVSEALTGAQCVRCSRLIAPGDGPVVKYDPRMHDGSTFTTEQAAAVGSCRWRRYAVRWLGECIAPVPDPLWKPMEPTTPAPYGLKRWSHLRLADDLAAAGVDTDVVALTAAGYFHPYRSPLPAPEVTLAGLLTASGHAEVAAAVLAGEYSAHPEERRAGQPVIGSATLSAAP